jgi:hypothetical protein
MAGHHGSSPLRRGSLQDALLSCVRGEIGSDKGVASVSDVLAACVRIAAICTQQQKQQHTVDGFLKLISGASFRQAKGGRRVPCDYLGRTR